MATTERTAIPASPRAAGPAVPESDIGAGGVPGCSGMPGTWKWQPARQSWRIPGAGHRRTPWRLRCRHGEDRPMGAGKPSLERPRNHRRFPPLGATQIASQRWPTYNKGGHLGGPLFGHPQRDSLRGHSFTVVVPGMPETPHQTRDDTDFPCRLWKSEAKLRLACPPHARRNGAPHERGADGALTTVILADCIVEYHNSRIRN